MRRWIAGVLIMMLTMSSAAPAARAQSTPLIGGGLTALPTESLGPNLVQNPGFETAGPASWPVSGGWSLDQLQKHGGAFSYRRDSGGTAQQTFQLKAGTYKASVWMKTQGLGSGASSGARLTLDFRPSGLNAWTPSDVISGTNDWQRVEIGPIVVDADRTAALMLEMYNGPGGTVWFDDVTLTKLSASGVEVFLLYPNFRGMLFDDGPSTLKFDVKTTPPGGDFGRYGLTATLKDEASGQVIATQSYAAADHFVADLDGGGMQAGRGYLATFSLVDKSAGNALVAAYPPYRVSKAPAAARQSMNVSFSAKNRVLVNGQPRFVLGVYDSGMGYSTDPTFWENTLWSDTGERRMNGLKINMYLNYWYGETPTDSIKALMTNLQSHGVTYLQTGNCFDKFAAGTNFLINNSDSYVQDLATHPGTAGFYTIDECIPSLIPGAFTQYDRLRRLAPSTITFMANFGDGNLSLWRDATDIVATDPYPMFGAEPAGGYNHKQVADWTANARAVVKDARPVHLAGPLADALGDAQPRLHGDRRGRAGPVVVEPRRQRAAHRVQQHVVPGADRLHEQPQERGERDRRARARAARGRLDGVADRELQHGDQDQGQGRRRQGLRVLVQLHQHQPERHVRLEHCARRGDGERGESHAHRLGQQLHRLVRPVCGARLRDRQRRHRRHAHAVQPDCRLLGAGIERDAQQHRHHLARRQRWLGHRLHVQPHGR